MKKLFLILAVVLPMAVLAQKTPVDKLFDKYANQDGITTVNLTEQLLQLLSQFDSGDESTNNVLSGLKGIRILSIEDEELNKKIDFYTELGKEDFFKNNKYEPLMEVTEDNEIIRLMAKNINAGKLTDLILVVSGDENTLIYIKGTVNLKDIGKITKAANIDLGDIDFNKNKNQKENK